VLHQLQDYKSYACNLHASNLEQNLNLDTTLVTHEPYLSALEIKGLYIKRYINSSVYFTSLYNSNAQ